MNAIKEAEKQPRKMEKSIYIRIEINEIKSEDTKEDLGINWWMHKYVEKIDVSL